MAEGIGIGLFIPLLQTLESGESTMAPASFLGARLTGVFVDIPENYRMLAIAAAIFGAILVKAALTFTKSALMSFVNERLGHNLRVGIFEGVLTADYRTLKSAGTGRLLNILSNESWRTAGAATQLIEAIITSCTLIVYATLLLLISWKLSIVVGVLLLAMVAIVRLVTQRVGAFGDEITGANIDMASTMYDGVEGSEVIRGYGREEYERGRFREGSRRLAKVTTRLGILSGAAFPVYEVLAAGILLVVLFASMNTTASLAPVLVFVFLLYRMAPIVKRLEKERLDLLASEAAIVETFQLLKRVEPTHIRTGKRLLDGLSDCISIEDLSYRYEPDSGLALDNVSAMIPARGLTAIVGPSGAGKSTLVRLLMRFLDPTSGRILVDGIPLKELRLDDWRERLSVVPQRAFLFNASVRENIAYGALGLDDEAVVKAAVKAGAHDFIESLPDGYDTKLGRDGLEVSGGEGQRICLARAIIREPEVLLLDEATNALDAYSESLIQTALEDIRKRSSIVAIAHRFATIEGADRVLVLDGGRIVEEGSPRDLLRRGGLFAQLYELQRFEMQHDGKAEYF